MQEELTSVQGELTVSTDRKIIAVPVQRAIKGLIESVKVSSRETSVLEGLTSVQGELIVSTDREVTAVPVLRAIEEVMQTAKVSNKRRLCWRDSQVFRES